MKISLLRAVSMDAGEFLYSSALPAETCLKFRFLERSGRILSRQFSPATRDNSPATRDDLPATHDSLSAINSNLPASSDNFPATRDPRRLDSPVHSMFIAVFPSLFFQLSYPEMISNAWFSKVRWESNTFLELDWCTDTEVTETIHYSKACSAIKNLLKP